MRPIQMVDTLTQYHRIKSEIDNAISDVLESAAYINGKAVGEFAERLSSYLHVKHVIPCANGTDALQIAMMALDLKPGDEVITPSFTFISTAEVIALLRLKPVFADVDPKTFCIDPADVKKRVTPKTRAIIPVHLFGQAAAMQEILDIADQFNLFVIEDNAQAIGCDYLFPGGESRKTGTLGHIGTTSFYPSKNLGAFGDGGAVFTNDDMLAQKIRMIANHGQSRRYYHDIVGCNSRLDTIQAAILNIKLKYLENYIHARRTAADYYDERLKEIPEIQIPYRAPYCRHVFHQYTLILQYSKRDELQQYLAAQGIPSMIYYPVPCHRQKMFLSQNENTVSLPVTEQLAASVISLPIHSELDEEQLEYIVIHIKNFFKI
ncbi:MAG: DegT/DnrJ/EryC1/StrS family aminotransferase [Chitinophagaceae bacterium]|nr:DegT/DnrJ/EryC1/StrS family aminotransferase [Chitinophagaceae bacterium]